MAKEFHLSPFGTLDHPWLNKPDTKYNKDGVYHTGLTLSGDEALAFKVKVDAEAEAAFERFWDTEAGKKVPQKDRSKWSVSYPYEEETDDNGNPTGYITFSFKQNAKIKLKSGEIKEIQVGIKDAAGKDMHKGVWTGSEGRAMYTFRDIPVPIEKKFGTRMDLAQVQITKLSSGSGGGPSFGAVEGGYIEDADAAAADDANAPSETDY